jgi:hypothetical protein
VSGQVFPSEAGPIGAFESNPRAFLAHVYANLLQAIAVLISLGYFAPLFFWQDAGWLRLVGGVVGIPVAVYTVRHWPGWRMLAEPMTLCLVGSVAPFLATQTLLYPRLHYAVAPVVVLGLLVARVTSSPVPQKP